MFIENNDNKLDMKDNVRRQNIINHLQNCTSLSEVKKLAKMHNAKQIDFQKLDSISNIQRENLPVIGHRTTKGF